jgi:hypothetical protein
MIPEKSNNQVVKEGRGAYQCVSKPAIKGGKNRRKGEVFQTGTTLKYRIGTCEIYGDNRLNQRHQYTGRNSWRGVKNKLPTLSKKDKANGKKIKQVA